MICSITSSGLEMPPDQKAFQTLSTWLLMAPVIMCWCCFRCVDAACPRRRRAPSVQRAVALWTPARGRLLDDRPLRDHSLYRVNRPSVMVLARVKT